MNSSRSAHRPRRRPTALCLAVALGIVLGTVPGLIAEELAALPPHVQVQVDSTSSRQTFYALQDEGTFVSLEGPAQLLLTSRAVFADGPSEALLSYGLNYRLDSGDALRIDVGGIDADVASRLRPSVLGAPAHPLTHRLTVPVGWHTFELKRGADDPPVLVRVERLEGSTTTQLPQSWTALEPYRPPPERSLRQADGSVRRVFRFNEENTLRFEPPSAGTLRVWLHSEHPAGQSTPFAYTIEVRVDGKPLHAYRFQAQPSTESAVVDSSARPGTPRHIIFQVDPGTGRRSSQYVVRSAIGSGRYFLGYAEFAPDPSP